MPKEQKKTAASRGFSYRPELVPADYPAAEVFGYPPTAETPAARAARERCWCPFRDGPCTKIDSPAETGVCSIRYKAAGFTSQTIWAICANRLAGEPFRLAAEHHFGQLASQADIVTEVRLKDPDLSFDAVAMLVDDAGEAHFVGIEAQTIDTRGGSIKRMWQAYIDGRPEEWRSYYPRRPAFGVNTTNVWKRLLPQVMNKGRMFVGWESRLLVVLQATVFKFIRERMPLKELSPQEQGAAEIIWLPWDYTGTTLADGMLETRIGTPTFTTLSQVEIAFVTVTTLQRPQFVKAVLDKLGRDTKKYEAARIRAEAEAAIAARPRLIDGDTDAPDSRP